MPSAAIVRRSSAGLPIVRRPHRWFGEPFSPETAVRGRVRSWRPSARRPP